MLKGYGEHLVSTGRLAAAVCSRGRCELYHRRHALRSVAMRHHII